MAGSPPLPEMNKRQTMLKHSYHARLSVWHVVLLVIILAISLPVIAKPASSSTTLLKQSSVKTQPVPKNCWQVTPYHVFP
jgi:hypothetical protein